MQTNLCLSRVIGLEIQKKYVFIKKYKIRSIKQ